MTICSKEFQEFVRRFLRRTLIEPADQLSEFATDRGLCFVAPNCRVRIVSGERDICTAIRVARTAAIALAGLRKDIWRAAHG